ncbi:MAG: helix-turn-helix transcriptional regulator [Bacillota bacterium]|jgi:RNA polymerase sigma factor (sigma-70 family)|nr:helix-turn-helix transcriptional regulator [Bacillota bacterium]
MKKRIEISLRMRLFLFLILFLVVIMLALLLIFFTTDVFSKGINEIKVFLANELDHIAGNVETEYGTLAVDGIALSETISGILEKEMKDSGVNPFSLKENPHLLNRLLDSCMDPLLAALSKNTASAAYLILDATVNPHISDADYSRAGLFLRNMEPNAINRSNPSIRYLRGPVVLAQSRNLMLLPQWEMEFRTTSGDFFHKTMENADSNLDISRQYYWNPNAVLHGDYENAMLLCVPLAASDGTVLGICGFEVSDMLFKLQNAPDISVQPRFFSILAPLSSQVLDGSKAMFAFRSENPKISGDLKTYENKYKLSVFETSDGTQYVGLFREINLYPKDAVHGDENWAVAVMLQGDLLNEYVKSKNTPMLILLALLLVFSIAAALYISRRYLSPVLRTIDKVKEHGLSQYTKTNIREIDDLFVFLAEQDAYYNRKEQTLPHDAEATEKQPERDEEAEAIFREFSRKLETLTRAEKQVFNLYVQGYDAKEITEILCLSINTIKTHNKRIYYKLGVSSRRELMVYLRKMREKGCPISIE